MNDVDWRDVDERLLPAMRDFVRQAIVEMSSGRSIDEPRPWFERIRDRAKAKAKDAGLTGLTEERDRTAVTWLESLLMECLFELIRAGVLAPSKAKEPWNYNDLRLTEFGRKIAAEGFATPFDRENYLGRLRDAGVTDPIVVFYISEALRTFSTYCYAATCVMVGVASEHLILELVNKMVSQFAADPAAKKLATELHKRYTSITRVADPAPNSAWHQLVRRAANHAGQDCAELWRQINQVYDIIRRYRNQAGHPTSMTVGIHEAYGCLFQFHKYAQTITQVIATL